jgi:hypothetical protein
MSTPHEKALKLLWIATSLIFLLKAETAAACCFFQVLQKTLLSVTVFMLSRKFIQLSQKSSFFEK